MALILCICWCFLKGLTWARPLKNTLKCNKWSIKCKNSLRFCYFLLISGVCVSRSYFYWYHRCLSLYHRRTWGPLPLFPSRSSQTANPINDWRAFVCPLCVLSQLTGGLCWNNQIHSISLRRLSPSISLTFKQLHLQPSVLVEVVSGFNYLRQY